MKNVSEYKKRFYSLLESEMGNVKPLLNEQQKFSKVDFVGSNYGKKTEKLKYEATVKLHGCMTKNGVSGSEMNENEVEITNPILVEIGNIVDWYGDPNNQDLDEDSITKLIIEMINSKEEFNKINSVLSCWWSNTGDDFYSLIKKSFKTSIFGFEMTDIGDSNNFSEIKNKLNKIGVILK